MIHRFRGFRRLAVLAVLLAGLVGCTRVVYEDGDRRVIYTRVLQDWETDAAIRFPDDTELLLETRSDSDPAVRAMEAGLAAGLKKAGM